MGKSILHPQDELLDKISQVKDAGDDAIAACKTMGTFLGEIREKMVPWQTSIDDFGVGDQPVDAAAMREMDDEVQRAVTCATAHLSGGRTLLAALRKKGPPA